MNQNDQNNNIPNGPVESNQNQVHQAPPVATSDLTTTVVKKSHAGLILQMINGVGILIVGGLLVLISFFLGQYGIGALLAGLFISAAGIPMVTLTALAMKGRPGMEKASGIVCIVLGGLLGIIGGIITLINLDK